MRTVLSQLFHKLMKLFEINLIFCHVISLQTLKIIRNKNLTYNFRGLHAIKYIYIFLCFLFFFCYFMF